MVQMVNKNKGYEAILLPIDMQDLPVLRRMQLNQLMAAYQVDEYSKVIHAYLSLVIQNSHLVGTGAELPGLGIDDGVEKQTLRREMNTIWVEID